MDRVSDCVAAHGTCNVWTEASRRDHTHFALQVQRGCIDQARGKQRGCRCGTSIERSSDFEFLQRPDLTCHHSRAEIAVGLEAFRRQANDRRMAGQIGRASCRERVFITV